MTETEDMEIMVDEQKTLIEEMRKEIAELKRENTRLMLRVETPAEAVEESDDTDTFEDIVQESIDRVSKR